MSNHYFLYLYVLGMDARTMLNGVTYAKSLRLSNKARQVSYLRVVVLFFRMFLCLNTQVKIAVPGLFASWNHTEGNSSM